ncbi:MAG: L-fucose:H+ symporter permease [Ferruginibacter sp.]
MPALPKQKNLKSSSTGNYLFPLILITSLFFFWGFVHNLDPILIPHLRRAFRLTTLQASLVDSAVFIAYFFMAIPAGLLLKKFGYKTGIITGLLLFAFGCFLFVPAANNMQYIYFLGALFIVACGLTVLETAANPYVSLLGPAESSTQRLNFAQSFNGLAAFIAPIIGGKLILSDAPLSDEAFSALPAIAKATYMQSETSTVKMPYLILGLVILLVAIIFFFTKLPEITDTQKDAKKGFFHALAHKHLKWAVVAQFFYVGAQVCVMSFVVLFATKAAGITEKHASYYAGVAGLVFMLGRFVGTFFMKFIAPPKLLTFYSIICIALSLVTIFGNGIITLYAIIGIAFFMSIMFPTIFALGIKDLGADTKSASSLIIMSIVGGAILPPLLGYISDVTQNIQYGYVVPMVCFMVTALFGWKGYKAI